MVENMNRLDFSDLPDIVIVDPVEDYIMKQARKNKKITAMGLRKIFPMLGESMARRILEGMEREKKLKSRKARVILESGVRWQVVYELL